MTMKEELIQLKDNLSALKDRIEADDPEAITEGEKLRGEIEAKEAAIDAAEKKAGLLNLIGNKETEDNTMPEKKMARTLGENFANAVVEKGAKSGQRFTVSAPDFKAYNDDLAVGTIGSPQVPRPLVTDIDKNIVKEVLPGIILRNLFGSETIQGNALTHPAVRALMALTLPLRVRRNRKSLSQIPLRPRLRWTRSRHSSRKPMNTSRMRRSWPPLSTVGCSTIWASVRKIIS